MQFFLSLCHTTVGLPTYILFLYQYNWLGTLDGTYMRVRVPLEDKPRYHKWKGVIATNVLGVCSQDMQFIYILVD